MLELDGVGKRYGETWAVRGVSLRLEPGSTVALIGPSGCGKSTLLRMLVGLITPSEGRVLFEGDPVETGSWRVLRRRIGYVIQDGGLLPHLTGRRNVTLPLRAAGARTATARGDVDHLAERTHLPLDALDRYPAELSGGQRQRLALMRALVTDPVVLLLDEPLGALDPQIRGDLQGELKQLFRELGKAVALVTHDLAEAAHLADEIVLLSGGSIVQRGSFKELVARPANAFVERFVASQVERVRGLLDGAAA